MPQRSSKYWEERFEILNDSLLKKGDDELIRLEKEYGKSFIRLEKEIGRWYSRLAENNGVTMQGAKKLLKADELKEFHWTLEEYIKYGKENVRNQEWVKELENASAKVHITELEEMQIHLRQQVEILSFQRDAGLVQKTGEIYEEGYYKSIFEIQKELPISEFKILKQDDIKAVLSTPWNGGKTFSKKIWDDREVLVNKLETELTQAIIRGDSLDGMIKSIAKQFHVNKSAAGRLVMTESAYFASLSQLNSYKELGIQKYKIVATLDIDTSNICRNMDGMVLEVKYFKPGVSAPPFHPWCRSCTAPCTGKENGTRIARDNNGKNYYVPADMEYPEWYSTYVKGKAYKELKKKETSYLIRKHAGVYDTTNEDKIILGAISLLPDKVQQHLSSTIIDIGKSGASQYDYNHDILYMAKGAGIEDVIHEMGHLFENKILNQKKVYSLMDEIIGEPTVFDIASEIYWDAAGNPREIFFLRNNKFVSEYQGRIYTDNPIDAFNDDGSIKKELLMEFISEPFRVYITDIWKLERDYEEFYNLIREALE